MLTRNIRRVLSLIAKTACLSAKRKLFLFEAIAALLISKLVLWILPFRILAHVLNRPMLAYPIHASKRDHIRKEITWAVATAADNLPMQFVCFPRGLAAHFLLRTHGLSSTMYIGINRQAGLTVPAHVWVMDGDQGVVGHQQICEYSVLISYPVTNSINQKSTNIKEN
jgi:hypothetical protein